MTELCATQTLHRRHKCDAPDWPQNKFSENTIDSYLKLKFKSINKLNLKHQTKRYKF